MSSALITRIAALEAEVKTLSTVPALSTFTESLKAASAEEVKAWLDVCSEVASKYNHSTSVLAKAAKAAKAAKTPKEPKEPKAPKAPKEPKAAKAPKEPKAAKAPKAPKEPKAAKEPKEKRAVTNATGPVEWNAFVRVTRHRMAEEVGVVIRSYDSSDEKDTKAAEKEFNQAATKAGVSYQAALQEAKKLKAASEGKDESAPKVKKTKKIKVVEAVAEAAGAVAEVVAEVVAEAAEVDESVMIAQGWEKMTIEGRQVWYCPSDDCVFEINGQTQIGQYYPDTATFVPTE